MKLRRIHICNFRGIRDQEVLINDYALLVGPNNSGKSTVIDAIRAFYEKDGFKFRASADSPKYPVEIEESWVELSFALAIDEFASLADEYKNGETDDGSYTLRVRKYFISKDPAYKEGTIYGYKPDGTLNPNPFYGAKNVQSGKFGDLIYIPALSKVDEHMKLTGPSALRDLLNDVMSEVVEAGDAYADFVDGIARFSDTIRDERTSDDRSLSGFESALNELLEPWDMEFRLRFAPPSANEIVKQMVVPELFDRYIDADQDFEHCGSGFQRHFIFSLIQLGARYVRPRAQRKTKDFVPSLSLILFEEPEAFLHPPQQEILARSLHRLSNDDTWQVICSTHSANFVSKNIVNIPSIVRMHRETDRIVAHQISTKDWDQIISSNQAINQIAANHQKMKKRLQSDDMKPEMEAIKHFLWLNADRSTLFFAAFVLLVEGPTEVALINKLIHDGRIQDLDCGLYILDCLGKYNIHRFMNLLNQLGIMHSVLHDDDLDKDEHKDINQLIEDSRDGKLTYQVVRIPDKLEAYLGVSSASSPHRKPQHLIYLYEEGAISQSNLDSFSQIVQSCIPGDVKSII